MVAPRSMDHPASSRRPSGAASNRPSSLLVHGVLLLGASAAVFLTADAEQGSLGVFLASAGGVLTLCPPRVRVDGWLWAAAGGIVAGGALALLPARWLHAPPWRTALEAVPAIPLPATVSPVPWETGFWLAVLAISAAVGLFALAHPLRTAGLVGVASAAMTVCLGYTALAIYAKQTGWPHAPAGGATFGFLPNRNHTATFLVVGSILAMGLLRVAWRDGRWAVGTLAAAGLTLFVPALGFYSASRGGIVFLFVGTVVWAAGLGRRERSLPLLVSLGTLLLAGGLLLAVSGSEVRARLLSTPDQAQTGETRPDFRVFIYQDTARLVAEAPWTGVGLGAFAAVFPQYQQRSLRDANVLHPESDWLMLVAEAGLPAGLAAGALGWLLWRHCRRWREHFSWPLRWACASAVAAACLHGVVDVPIHRVALGWWVLTLAGTGLHGGWMEGSGRSRVQHGLFVAAGLLALTLGTLLIRAQWFGAAPLPPFAAAAAFDEIDRAIQRGDYSSAARLCEAALPRSPLFEGLYFQKGLLQVQAEADAASDETFRAQRLVNPALSTIPLSQGMLWINDDPARTAVLWREAFLRAQRIHRRDGAVPDADLAFYRDLLARADGRPDLARTLLAFADDDPPLTLAWLENNPPPLVAEAVARLAADDRFLEALDAPGRRRFLAAWYVRGERAALPRWLEEHPRWEAAARPLRLRLLLDAGRFEEAVRTTVSRLGISLELPPPGPPAAAGLLGEEAADPAAAFAAYWRGGNEASARRVLVERGGDGVPLPPPELVRLKLALAVHDAAWQAAWQAAAQYLNRTGHTEDLPL